MAEFVLLDVRTLMDGFDISGVLNEVTFDHSIELQDNTVFGDTSRSFRGALQNLSFSHRGFYDDALDVEFFNRMAVNDIVMSIIPEGNVDGNRAFTFKTVESQYSPGGTIGEMFQMTLNGSTSGPFVRGLVMATGQKTVTENGTARQLGAVSAGQRMYLALHVTAVSGTAPTLDVTVESDDAMGFASPTTRITIPTINAVGSAWGQADGPITDDWWRIVMTIGGTTPSFTLTGVLGIR